MVEDGYRFQGNKSILTIFSAPNYCGEYDNFGACLSVSEDMKCQLKKLEKTEILKNNRVKRSVTPLPMTLDSISTELRRSKGKERVSRTRTPTKMVLKDKKDKIELKDLDDLDD